ncbi:MAG TPA: sulfurtransferase TusA family protein [Spirochaetota bacterium]|nr:sulfurtransferase TusA family protein [Spirochaetota bacterium]
MQILEKLVDTRGYSCPIPIAMVSRKMHHLAEGDTVTVVFDDAGFRKELEAWCAETGNAFIDYKLEKNFHTAVIGKGAGFKKEGIKATMAFILLGIKLHFIKIILGIIPVKRIRYLITFVSIPEGLRADRWLDENGNKKHVALPVPSDITAHCGVVLGFSGREEAEKAYRLLLDNRFAAEDVYVIEKESGTLKLDI